MSLEIEKRFKNFDYKTLKKLFEKYNIQKNGGYLFNVTSFIPLKENQIIRTRNEGDKITFTIKEKTNTYDKEWEVIIDNQNMMNEMLQLLGIKKAYDLEKFREIYKDDNNELVFDHYPGLQPYLEIESNSEVNLEQMMLKLNLITESKFNAKELYYLEYGISKDRPDKGLTFNNALEMFDSYITKNKDKFIKILNHQQEFIKKYLKK
jgi:predicted adenylyl cyclase CyaB